MLGREVNKCEDVCRFKGNKVMNSGGSPAEGVKGRNNRIQENYQTFRCTGRDLGSKNNVREGMEKVKLVTFQKWDTTF